MTINTKFVRITFAIFAFSWFLGDYTGNWHDDYKYVFWIMSAGFGMLPIIYYALGYKLDKKKWDTYTFKAVAITCAVFILVSILGMAVNGGHLLFFKDIYYIFMPAVYIFVIANMDDGKNLNFYIDFIFWGFVANFLLIAKPSSFTPANFMSMSFADSYSPWESGLADLYMITFSYYFFTKQKGKAILAGILTFMSFKRLNLVYMGFLLIFGRFFKPKPIPRAVEVITKGLLILSPILIYTATDDAFSAWFESAFGMDLNSFTMGRFNQINFINDLDENMTGLGMTHYMLVVHEFDIHRLHCDVIRIYIETTIVGLVFFVNNYLNIGKRDQRGFSLVLFFMIVMVTSTCIENTFYWLTIFLICENYERRKKVEAMEIMEEKQDGETVAIG